MRWWPTINQALGRKLPSESFDNDVKRGTQHGCASGSSAT
jgi:hypothetical protein